MLHKRKITATEVRFIEIIVDVNDTKYTAETSEALLDPAHPDHDGVIEKFLDGSLHGDHHNVESGGYERIQINVVPSLS